MFMEWVLGSVVMSVSVVVAVAVWVWVYVSCWQSWLGAKIFFFQLALSSCLGA